MNRVRMSSASKEGSRATPRRPAAGHPPAVEMRPQRLPLWARPDINLNEGGGATAVQVGAALAMLDATVAVPAAHAGAWIGRLALAAAAVSVARSGRPEDEESLRDLVALGPALTAGPVTPVMRAYLWLGAGPVAPRWTDLPALIADLGARDAPLADELAGRLATAACPLAATAAALQAVLAIRPDRTALAMWAADVALARWLGWPFGLPLVSLGLPRGSFDLAALTAAEGSAGLAAVVLRGSARALDRFVLLGHRAAALQAARPRLRARAAGRVVDRLLARDAVSVAGVRDLIPERAARRLFDRLVALGAVREMTGRPTARLYGL